MERDDFPERRTAQTIRWTESSDATRQAAIAPESDIERAQNYFSKYCGSQGFCGRSAAFPRSFPSTAFIAIRGCRRCERNRKGTVLIEGLTFAGTFHSVGARLLREYASYIGLDPAFTIHDHEDSADLMNPVRHELGLSQTESRFPAKGTCLAIYSHAVNARFDLAKVLAAASFP